MSNGDSPRVMECRWCGVQVTAMAGAYVDDQGFFNCAKNRRHWPVEPTAIPLGSENDGRLQADG